MASGARAGMALAQARALFPLGAVRIAPHDLARDRRAIRRLAVWAHRLAPTVSVEDPDALLLDVTGCARVWGGEPRLARHARLALADLGVRARIAIAPTFTAAWAMARHGPQDETVTATLGVRAALTPLPVEALRVDAKLTAALREMGIERVGDLIDLPRSALPARFGDDLLLALDRALGQAVEIIDPLRPAPPPEAERLFDGPTDRIEAVEHAVRALLDDLCAALRAREVGAGCIAVELQRSDLGPERFEVTLGRPARDAARLWSLVRPKLERAHLGFGVEAVRVRATEIRRVAHEQHAWQAAWGGGPRPAAGADRAWAELLDALTNRMGPDRVRRARLVEAHQPERAFVRTPALDTARPEPVEPEGMDRPGVLFERPCPVEVVALSPDGPVHRVWWRGRAWAVTACFGPERIGEAWWRSARSDGEDGRDYFAVRTEDGRWLWLARGVSSGRWVVHGVWA